ncbi:hypothetical protein CsSME_00042522 [Camellia sinensis var. sinensis]
MWEKLCCSMLLVWPNHECKGWGFEQRQVQQCHSHTHIYILDFIVASTASLLQQQRIAINKRIMKISELGIPV